MVKRESGKKLVGYLAASLIAIISKFYVLTMLFNWYVVPITHFNPISYSQAYILFISCLLVKMNSNEIYKLQKDTQEMELDEAFTGEIAVIILAWFCFIVAYLVK